MCGFLSLILCKSPPSLLLSVCSHCLFLPPTFASVLSFSLTPLEEWVLPVRI